MLEYLIKGGSLMIPLVVESVLAVAAVFDRLWAFHQNAKVDARVLRSEILTLLEEDRLEDAILLCASTPGPVAAVLLVGLQSYRKLREAGDTTEAIRQVTAKAMEDYHTHAMSAVEKRFGILTSVGNSAPLFGMAGTVTGMIKSFDAMAKASGLDANLVAAGISEALITTAAGLLIALAAVIPYNVFASWADKIALEIEDATAELIEYVSMRVERGGKA